MKSNNLTQSSITCVSQSIKGQIHGLLTHIYGLDYNDTFSPIIKMTIVRLFLVMATIFHWPLH